MYSYLSLPFVLLCSTLLFLSRADYPGAHACAASLYQRFPSDLEVVNNFAVCCMYVNQIDSAVKALEKCIREDPIK
jgi:hypothetical protein